uniref:GIT Spa2 homology (SHD) domain-containing protein n=1 Tax=Chelydra serpentina TaxID=8475 RepID=A0A8C3STY9_CHESE
MVHTLASNGANSIWEHSLLDPAQVQSGRRKANPQDKVHPTKSEFIRAKYQMLAFVHKLPCRDDDGVTAKDLSKQLHSSVRTGNLETCLRLLSLGAQPSFFHPEKGTTPLHVAAKAGQILQAELLVVYGADPGAPDVNGRTPIDYARQAAQQELADRLVECQYELTDRLAFYLCGRKPGDSDPSCFVSPRPAVCSLDLSELAKVAKKKLQALSNRLFEELAMDVYDEVDRRENDAVWLTTQNHSTLVTERSAVPFLPVNPEYSATRNQGRQKLARFNAREFATLIIDILSEAKRRQQGKSLVSPTDTVDYPVRSQSDPDDQHDYDSVASDEDTDQEPLRSAARNNRARVSSRTGEAAPAPSCCYGHFLRVVSAGGWARELGQASRLCLLPSFVPCSEKIHAAVAEMASLFPKKPALETVRSSLRLLSASAYRLQSECHKTVPPEPGAPVDYQLLTQQVIQCAYDIAKAAKQLVTITTREKKQ